MSGEQPRPLRIRDDRSTFGTGRSGDPHCDGLVPTAAVLDRIGLVLAGTHGVPRMTIAHFGSPDEKVHRPVCVVMGE